MRRKHIFILFFCCFNNIKICFISVSIHEIVTIYDALGDKKAEICWFLGKFKDLLGFFNRFWSNYRQFPVEKLVLIDFSKNSTKKACQKGFPSEKHSQERVFRKIPTQNVVWQEIWLKNDILYDKKQQDRKIIENYSPNHVFFY